MSFRFLLCLRTISYFALSFHLEINVLKGARRPASWTSPVPTAFTLLAGPLDSSYHHNRYRLSSSTALQATNGTPLSSSSSSSPSSTTSSSASSSSKQLYRHAMAILAMPTTSVDKIANSVILETVIPQCRKLSVVLKCESGPNNPPPSLSQLRAYVGEVYSQLWDVVVNTNLNQHSRNNISNESENPLIDVVVYPSNLPNAAPESWIHIQRDLEAICSHSNYLGWTSEGHGRGQQFAGTEGSGGLVEHVEALNRERRQRQLPPVVALSVPEQHWPMPVSAAQYAQQHHVVFLEDELPRPVDSSTTEVRQSNDVNDDNDDSMVDSVFLGGAKPDATLFDNVAVGGTFDGMHYGHRKLLTLAISATHPLTGKLLVGVTADQMLQHKELSQLIRPFDERRRGVVEFLSRLAPGMLNRIKVVEITDAFGPPAHDSRFDALVLSHETLETGCMLNRHRIAHGMPPLTLLCTRRTEAHGMSSTALRKAMMQQRS